jgi:PAS domain S-box-containing protein
MRNNIENENLVSSIPSSLNSKSSKCTLELDSALHAIAFADLDSKITYVNNAFLEMWGYQDKHEVIGRPTARFWKSSKAVQEIIEYIWQNNYWVGNLVAKKKDGSHFIAQVHSHLIYNSEGEPVKKMASFLNLSENYKKTKHDKEQKVKAALYKIANSAQTANSFQELYEEIHKCLSNIIDTQNLYVALYHPNTDSFSIPYAQDKYDEITEFKADKTLTNQVVKQNRSILVNYDEILELKAKGHIDLLGEPCKAWLGVPLVSNNKIIGAMVVQDYQDQDAYDEDDRQMLEFVSGQIATAIVRKQNDENLQKAYQKLQEMNKDLKQKVNKIVNKLRKRDHILIQQARQAAMGEMIGNIAHQWRQPLAAVSAIIQDLEDAYEFEELDAKYMETSVQKAMQQLEFMSHTIDDFRNFFSPRKAPKEFNIKETVNKTIKFIASSLFNNDIKLEYQLEDVKIEGFPQEYSQVLLNILKNAKDSIMSHRKDDGRVTIKLYEKSNKSFLEILDNGGGIPADILPKIFDPYFTTKKQGEGTGVGLYMSKKIIEKMGGTIKASNTENGAKISVVV